MQPTLIKLAPYAKAVAAFLALLVPVLAALAKVLIDVANNQLDGGDVTLLGAAVVALFGGTHAVKQVTNKPLPL